MKKQQILIGSVIIIIALVVLITSVNWQDTKGKGTILLSGIPEGATIFLDNKREGRTTQSETSRTFTNLTVGTHTIVIAKDGYWPWSKKLSVANNETISVDAFLIPQEPSREVLKETDEEYQRALSSITSYVLPIESSPLQSKDGSTELWATENAIMARWISEEEPSDAFCITGVCEKTFIVLPINLPIRNLAFLPGRNDVIIFSAQNGIFALELDKRGTQNFEPLYLGTTPQFAEGENATLIVKDERVLFLIHF